MLAKLIWDLQSFLSVLDSENLSYIAQAQKKSISELLSKLQTNDAPGKTELRLSLAVTTMAVTHRWRCCNTVTCVCVCVCHDADSCCFSMFPVEDAEYMIMSCPSLSPSNEQIDTPAPGSAEPEQRGARVMFSLKPMCLLLLFF